MGMKDAFSLRTSRFFGHRRKEGLYLGKVKQDAMMDVNEEGTEAVAATRGHTGPDRSAIV